jgi:hypothetical protein
MRQTLILSALLAASAHACEPARDSIKAATDDTGNVGVLVWRCGAAVEWVGVRNKADLTLPRDPKTLAAHLARLRVQHGYDRVGMADLRPLVAGAK